MSLVKGNEMDSIGNTAVTRLILRLGQQFKQKRKDIENDKHDRNVIISWENEECRQPLSY